MLNYIPNVVEYEYGADYDNIAPKEFKDLFEDAALLIENYEKMLKTIKNYQNKPEQKTKYGEIAKKIEDQLNKLNKILDKEKYVLNLRDDYKELIHNGPKDEKLLKENLTKTFANIGLEIIDVDDYIQFLNSAQEEQDVIDLETFENTFNKEYNNLRHKFYEIKKEFENKEKNK